MLDRLPQNITRVLGPVGPNGKLVDQRLCQVVVEGLVEALLVAPAGLERGEVEHDDALGPVDAVRRVVGALPQKVKVGLAKLDVDAAAVRRRHDDALLELGVEELARALEQLVGHGDGHGQLQGQAAHAVLPLRLLVRVEAADQDVVVPPVHGPFRDGLVGGLLAEVGLLPLAKEDLLRQHVGCGKDLAALQDGLGGESLEVRDGEGVLEPLLLGRVGRDDVVIALVELALVRPPLMRGKSC